MFTRFRTPSAAHLFNAPMIRVAPTCPGASFLSALGGAYESEESHLRSRMIQHALDLHAHLDADLSSSKAPVKKFIDALQPLLEFLNSITDNSVDLYSYESSPSIDEILTAFSDGGGANDWALEEIGRRGNRGRSLLTSALTSASDTTNQLSAVAMLLILCYDRNTLTAIHKFTERADAETAKEVSLLLAAYNRE